MPMKHVSCSNQKRGESLENCHKILLVFAKNVNPYCFQHQTLGPETGLGKLTNHHRLSGTHDSSAVESKTFKRKQKKLMTEKRFQKRQFFQLGTCFLKKLSVFIRGAKLRKKETHPFHHFHTFSVVFSWVTKSMYNIFAIVPKKFDTESLFLEIRHQ